MDRVDVLVVGAGPAGASAARAAAEAGGRVLVVDQREELGHPAQCGEFLPEPFELEDLFGPSDLLHDAYGIPEETVLRTITTMICIAPSGRRYSCSLHGAEVSRRSFDKRLAYDAEGAGAELRYPCGVTKVRPDGARFTDGTEVESRTIVAADGPVSLVSRARGFSVPRQMYRMVTATVDGQFEDAIELHFGRVAPSGYAWLFPKLDEANVGLGVPQVPRGTSLDRLLNRFLERRGVGPPRDWVRWWVPLGPPPESAVRGNALFTGDAANLVMATNGGGIPTAILSGFVAGRVAAGHVRAALPLGCYDEWLRSYLRPALARGWKLKRWADRWVAPDLLLSLGMRYIGSEGLDAFMRMRSPIRLRSGA